LVGARRWITEWRHSNRNQFYIKRWDCWPLWWCANFYRENRGKGMNKTWMK